jgi:hypothetical protein
MWILLVFFKSGLSMKEALALIETRADSYRHVKGLLQKFWIHDESSGHLGGIYVFDSKDSLVAFQNSAMAKGIADAYRFVEPPTKRALKVTHVLYQRKKRSM